MGSGHSDIQDITKWAHIQAGCYRYIAGTQTYRLLQSGHTDRHVRRNIGYKSFKDRQTEANRQNEDIRKNDDTDVSD